MKKGLLAKLILLIIIASLFVGMLLACDDATTTTPPDTNSGTVKPLEKSEILSNLADRLDNTIEAVDNAKTEKGVVNLMSNYAFMAEGLKYTITYNVNYDYSTTSKSRSDIYLKIYDEEYNKTRVMFYYKNGTLYVDIDNERSKINNFGSSGMFEIFYAFVSYFDMSTIVVDEDFASSVEELDSFIESKKLSQFKTGENGDNISLTGVNFDTKKGTVNDLLTSAFGRFGTTYDAISEKLLGVKLSYLAGMQIMTLDANLVEFYSTDGTFNKTAFDFGGMLESKWDFSLEGSFSIGTTRRDLEVSEWDDEDEVLGAINKLASDNQFDQYTKQNYIDRYTYKSVDMSRSMYEGVFSLDILGTSYDVELFYDYDEKDDKDSEMSLRLFDQGSTAAAAYYNDGSGYVDLGDLYDSFNKAFGLKDYNFPRIYSTTFSLKDIVDQAYEVLDMLVRDLFATSAAQQSGLWDIVQEKVIAEGTVTTLYIDKKLLTSLNALKEDPYTQTNVVVFIADLLGIDRATIEEYFTGDEFDTLRILVSYDTLDDSLEIKLQMTATEADAKNITSVDEAPELYTDIGDILPLSSKFTANSIDYYFYQYAGTLYTNKQRSVVTGSFKGDLNTIYVTLSGQQEVSYTFGTATYGIVELLDAELAVVGKYYTAQEYMTIGDKTYYFTKDEYAPKELYSDQKRTELVNNLDFSKYMFKYENMYYYLGQSATYYLGYLSAGNFDIFTQTFSIASIVYNYGHGISYRRGELLGIITPQDKIVITETSPSQIFLKKTTDTGKIGLYKEGDENQEIVGYYNADSLSIEFTAGQFEGNVYLIDIDNNLMRMYGTVDMNEKQVVINDYTYNLNFGSVFSTEEGIDDLATLDLVRTDEVRSLYYESGKFSAEKHNGFSKVEIGGIEYYFTNEDTRVFNSATKYVVVDGKQKDNAVIGASVNLRRGSITIGNVEYLLGSFTLVDQGSEKEVGHLDLVDGLVSIGNDVFEIIDNKTIVGIEKAGELTIYNEYILYNGNSIEEYVLSNGNELYKDGVKYGTYNSTDGVVTFTSGTFSGKKYIEVGDELREVLGSISLTAFMLNIGTKGYEISQKAPVYLVSGNYFVVDNIIELNGVRYHVEDGKIYSDATKLTTVGTVDDSIGKIALNGKSYLYKQTPIEVLRHSYKPASYPEDLGFSFSGEVTLSQVNELDISSFLGAFIGDGTGVNTPYTLRLGEKIVYQIKVAYHGDELMLYAHLYHAKSDGTIIRTLFTVASANDVEGDLLVDYYVMGKPLKFRTTADQILTALKSFAGDESVFNAENATDALYKIFGYADLSFLEEGMAYSIVYNTATGVDPIKELVGLEKLSSTGIFTVDYDMVIPEVDTINLDIDSYNVPIINITSFVQADSIHDVNWIETVDVTLGDNVFEGMTIPYIESTITIVDGKTIYEPTASLFGKTISYRLVLAGENGTSAVTDIVGGAIEIDPWAAVARPEKLKVYLDNGNIGEVSYRIVGFDDNTITDYGNAKWDSDRHIATYPTYDVIVSENSIGEVLFADVPVIVKSRLLSNVKGSVGTTDIVATTTIDPYDYDTVNNTKVDGEMPLVSSSNIEGANDSAERFFIRWENGQKTLWSYIPIEFYSYYTLENAELKERETFYIKWDFDFSKVSFRGGEYLAKAVEVYKEKLDENGAPVVDAQGNKVYEQCATKEIATTVLVSPKVADHLYLYNITTDQAEAAGVYTVDSLKQSTYVIPTRSTDDYMILLYFADGRFRVIGDETVKKLYADYGLIEESYCDGVFNIVLDWTYDEADYITIYGTTSPLGGGSASLNTATLESSSIGNQTLTLTVNEPSREVLLAGTETGYTKVDLVGNVVARSENVFPYNEVSWTGDESGINKPFEINPYKFAETPLPTEVTVAVNEARGQGQTAIKYLTYPIESWDLSTNIISKGADNRYYLRYPTAEGANFRAEATIGDGKATTTISVVIRNIDAEYLYYQFEGFEKKAASDKTVLDVNAYSPYKLPETFYIYIDGVEEPMEYSFGEFSWFIDYGQATEKEIGKNITPDVEDGKYILWDDETYNSFNNFVLNGEGRFDSSWLDDKYYFFDNVAGEITLLAYIPSSVEGALEQKLELTLNVVEMNSFKLATSIFEEQSADNEIVYIDTYAEESAILYSYLRHLSADGSNYVSILPLEMFSTTNGKTYTYYQPMTWAEGSAYSDLLENLLAQGQAEKSVEIAGTTVLGSSDISATITCIDRRITSEKNFYFVSLNSIDEEILTSQYTLNADTGEKYLIIDLKKPYALTLHNNNTSAYALPSEFFEAALGNINVVFSSADYKQYPTNMTQVLEAWGYIDGETARQYDFDGSVLDFGTSGSGTDSQIEFVLKVGSGSAIDNLNVSIVTRADSVESRPNSYQVDIYTNDGIGSPKYPNGYEIPTEYIVEYTNSGTVIYRDLVWRSSNSVNALQVTKIDSKELSNERKTYTLYSRLPDGSPITLNINFTSKNIGEVNYDSSTYNDGTTNSQTVAAADGIIALNNIYELYDLMLFDGTTRVFDITKLPNVLLPQQTDTFVDSARIDNKEEPPIRFRVDWTIEDFFDASGKIIAPSSEAADGTTVYKIATATILGYNNASQTVALYVTIADKDVAQISAEGYDFRYENNIQRLYIDPYEEILVDGKAYYIWQKDLPQNVTLTLGDGTTYTFTRDELSYTFGEKEISTLVYDYKQFEFDNAKYSQMVITMHLPDGTPFNFEAVMINRTYAKVELPYTAVDNSIKYTDRVYFIDPYNEATYNVPTEVTVVFEDGGTSTLSLAWTKYATAARVTPIDDEDVKISYLGGEYFYRATLEAYRYIDGELKAIDSQDIDVDVVVINRSIKTGVVKEIAGKLVATGENGILKIARTFSVLNNEDHISMRLEDIYQDKFTKNDFVQMPDRWLAACPDMLITYPEIVWDKGVADSSIVDGMDGTKAIIGYLDNTKGQKVEVYLTTDRLTLESFDPAKLSHISTQGTPIIYFNPYTSDSLSDKYNFIFGVQSYEEVAAGVYEWVEKDDVSIEFYTRFIHEADDDNSRRLIYWAENLSTGENVDISAFMIGNKTKTMRIASNNVIFASQALVISFVRVDLGLGDTDNTAGKASFVIDPLQPYLPESLDNAYGWFSLGSTVGKTEEELNEFSDMGYAIIGSEFGVWLPLGKIDIRWSSNALTNLTYRNPDRQAVKRTVGASIRVSGTDRIITELNFDMYYLDRTPVAILTDRSEANIGYGVLSGSYPDYNDLTTTSGIEIDPLSNYSNGSYHLMTMVNIRFEYEYKESDTDQKLLYAAVQKYGKSINIQGLTIASWDLGGKSITIAGTTLPINASLVKGTVITAERNYELTIPRDSYVVEVNVKNKAVTSSSISTNYDKETKTFTVSNPLDGSVDYSIDPYNIQLPQDIKIVLGNESRTFNFVVNTKGELPFTPETADRLKDISVINGDKSAEHRMNVTAYIMICGEQYNFNFAIKPRKVDVMDEEITDRVEIQNEGTLINGGTIYILAVQNQQDAEAQLPEAMYYDFGNNDYTRVPLKYNASDLVGITKPGTYSIKATLGLSEDGANIIFEVIVVDAKLYEIRTITDAFGNVTDSTMYDLIYDKIIVSVSTSGERLEDLDSMWMPQYISLFEDTELDIESVEFDFDAMVAIFTCKYVFQDDTRNFILAGDSAGNKVFTFSLSVPIVQNAIDSYVGQATLTETEVHYDLGEEITLTSLPKAEYNGQEYYVYWDVTGRLGGDKVDKFRAGSYTIYGEALTGLREVQRFTLTLVVDQIDISNIANIPTNDLNYAYTGVAQGNWQYKINFGDVVFLDENGENYDYTQDIVFEFSMDGSNWIETEFLNVGTYYIRVSIDELNLTGSKVFTINIMPAEINGSLITFENTTQTYTGTPLEPTILYDGKPLPRNIRYSFSFYRYIGNERVEYQSAINASADGYGAYIAELSFEDNANYSFSSISNMNTTFNILKKNVNYQLAETKVYSGNYEHIEIIGLPSTYAAEGVRVQYTYTYADGSRTYTTSNPVKDIGTYKVLVEILGGNNYNSMTLARSEYIITAAILTVTIEDIICTYPATAPLAPIVTYSGKQGSDMSIPNEELFGNLIISSSVSDYVVPIPGEYQILAEGLFNKNYKIEYKYGTYTVRLPAGVVALNKDEDLQTVIDNAIGNSLKLYLPANDYGDIVIQKSGMSVTLLGECNKDGTYGATFKSLTLASGSLELSAIGFIAREDTISFKVKKDAGNVVMTKVVFYGATYDSISALEGSVAVEVSAGYAGLIAMSDVHIKHRVLGLNVYSGRVSLESSTVSYNASGIAMRGGNISMINTRISHSSIYGLYLASIDLKDNYELINNMFNDNIVAIRYSVLLPVDSDASVISGNTYRNNQSNLQQQQ